MVVKIIIALVLILALPNIVLTVKQKILFKDIRAKLNGLKNPTGKTYEEILSHMGQPDKETTITTKQGQQVLVRVWYSKKHIPLALQFDLENNLCIGIHDKKID